MTRTSSRVVRLIARLASTAVFVAILAITGIQFAHILAANIALKHSLVAVQQDVRSLQTRSRDDRRELRRLNDPNGAIPDIHERLHLVRPNEAIIYLKQPPPRRKKD